MNYQTWQLTRIHYCWMLLLQVSGTNSEPSQTYKMEILAKIVNDLKLILKHILWAAYTRILRFYLFGHLHHTSDPTDLKTKKFPFLSYLLTLTAPCILESCSNIKINLNFYFHTSLWCLKRFYEGFKDLHKTI